MKKIFLVILLIAEVSLSCYAGGLNLFKKKDKPRLDYTEWISIQDLPAEENGVKIFYPSTEPSDSSAVVKGRLMVPGLTGNQVFLAAMVYAVNNFDTENGECFLAVDYDRHEFSLMLKSTQGTNSRETTYTRNILFQAADGQLDFRVTDISARYREKGLIPRTLPMEQLHPESNTRHGELVMEFVSINSAYLGEMASYAATRADISAPNIQQVKNGTVAVGMNPDEVRLVLGAPWEERRSGERKRWIYGNETVVIFTDGRVSRVIQ